MGYRVTNTESTWVYPDAETDDDAHAAWLQDHANDPDQSVVIAPWSPPPEVPRDEGNVIDV